MNRVQAWLTGIALACVASAAFAAPAPPDHFAARFVEQRTLPGFDEPVVSHGVMRISHGKRFRWEITRPYQYVFEMADGHAREKLPDGTTRTLDSDETPWLKAVEHIFVGALSGNLADLKRYFKLDIQSSSKVQGRQVVLTPKSDTLSRMINRIDVTEDAAGHPRRLKIDEASGGRLDIRFTPIQSDTQR
jgi:outer membrane lipoprotein-sorting protein